MYQFYYSYPHAVSNVEGGRGGGGATGIVSFLKSRCQTSGFSIFFYFASIVLVKCYSIRQDEAVCITVLECLTTRIYRSFF